MKRFTQFIMVIAAVFAVQLAVIAQTGTGRLVGSVAGIDGAVIPGATVALTDSATGKVVTTVTNGEGAFTFALVDFGTYTVKVTSTGFKTTTTTIKVEAGKEYSLPVTLQVGDVSENVTVTAGTDLVNSSNAELNSTISNRQITELPLAARNPLTLILTQAGTSSNPSQNTSINGGRTSSTNITRDGVNINDNFIRSNATDFSSSRVSVDNVEEFTLSSQASVDSGFGSAQVSFVTPRGGNEFHGAGWEYNRNSAVAANSWFNNANGNYGAADTLVLAGLKKVGDPKSPRPFRNRNQYGGKVSGPIIKNKLFFFAYYERLNDIVFANKLTTVLTASARAGNFKWVSGGNTYTANIFCPGCWTVGAGGAPLPVGINPTINSAFLAGMPEGNTPEAGDGLNTTGYRFSQQANQKRESATTRIDYDLNAKNNINVVIDYNRETNLRSDLGGTTITPQVLQPARNVIYSGGWRWSPSATVSNEFKIGQLYSAPEFNLTVPVPSEYYTAPLITQPYAVNGTPPFRYQGRLVTTRNYQDTLTWLRGSHGFRFGFQYQQVKVDAYNDAGISPVYALGISSNGPVLSVSALGAAGGAPAANAPTATAGTARNLFALLGGIISGGGQTFNPSSTTSGFVPNYTQFNPMRFNLIAPYALDQWKIRPDLTLNIGMRWDYQTPLTIENGLFWEPKITTDDPLQSILDPAGTMQFVGGNAGRKNAFYKPDKNNVAPSIGIAWAPKFENGILKKLTGENFVLRGGYRRSYVNDETVTAPRNALANHPGFSSAVSATLTCASTSTALDDRAGSPHTSCLPTPAFVSSRSFTTNNTAAFSNTGTVFGVDPNLQTPNQNDYQIGIQRQLPWGFVGEARYVGGYSKNMLRTIDYNQIIIPAAFKADFAIARANVLSGCATAVACAAGTTLISQMGNSGNIIAGANFGSLNANAQRLILGLQAELAWQYIVAGGTNGIQNPNTTPVPTTGAASLRSMFLPNPNAGVVNMLLNGGRYNYNSLQFELRRRFSDGLYFQANYTFGKELTDAVGTGQTRVEPYLDNANKGLDYTRADYDQTHVININSIYELPFGKGRRWLNSNKWLDYAVGGWQLGLVWRIASGSPITFTDGTGTLNRAGRSGRQTALTNLSSSELRGLLGVFKTPCGVYFVNPKVININQANLAAGLCTQLNVGLTSGTLPGSNQTAVFNTTGGAAASGYGLPTFAGQVFFNNGPGQTGTMRRAIVNGPWYSSADLSLAKTVSITERIKFQIRGEAYNFMNTPYFTPGQFIDIQSTSFGKIGSVAVGARVVQFAGRLTF